MHNRPKHIYSGNKSWIRLISGVSIVDRWVVVVFYCFDRLVLLISVVFQVVSYFLGFIYLRVSVLLFIIITISRALLVVMLEL